MKKPRQSGAEADCGGAWSLFPGRGRRDHGVGYCRHPDFSKQKRLVTLQRAGIEAAIYAVTLTISLLLGGVL
jgi:hypothetical protein